MKCVNCYHCQVCALRKGSIYADIDCGDFKDKRCIIEMPVPLGTTVYVISEANHCNIPDDKDCPYWDCDGCEYENYDYDIIEKVVDDPLLGMTLKGTLGDTVFLTKEDARHEIDRLNTLHEELKDESRIF